MTLSIGAFRGRYRRSQRRDLHHHTGPTTIGDVVNSAARVVRKTPRIKGINANQPVGARLPYNAASGKGRDKLGKNSDDAEAVHRLIVRMPIHLNAFAPDINVQDINPADKGDQVLTLAVDHERVVVATIG